MIRIQMILRSTAAAALAVLLDSGMACALNPQPEPPGIVAHYQLADGRVATLVNPNVLEVPGRDGRLAPLPPGPCVLKGGKTVHVGAGGHLDQTDLDLIKKWNPKGL